MHRELNNFKVVDSKFITTAINSKDSNLIMYKDEIIGCILDNTDSITVSVYYNDVKVITRVNKKYQLNRLVQLIINASVVMVV